LTNYVQVDYKVHKTQITLGCYYTKPLPHPFSHMCRPPLPEKGLATFLLKMITEISCTFRVACWYTVQVKSYVLINMEISLLEASALRQGLCKVKMKVVAVLSGLVLFSLH